MNKEEKHNIIKKYSALINRFLNREISADEFQDIYLETYLTKKERLGEELYDILEQLFGDTECYSDMPPPPKAAPGFHVTEAELYECAKRALDGLEKIGRNQN
jgi:hypothetical protein